MLFQIIMANMGNKVTVFLSAFKERQIKIQQLTKIPVDHTRLQVPEKACILATVS